MEKRKLSDFRFDAALSFAGQDRPRAEAVARAMQSLGIRVFYDKDDHAHLWGKNRIEYEKIYGPDSAYVVPLISEHYAKREWTQWEFETAKREARNRKGDFLLPIRIDGSRQFGLTDDHNYLDADDFTPQEIAQALKAKLDAEFDRRAKSTSAKGAYVLTAAERTALGLIVASPVPMTARHLKSLFPVIEWSKHLRNLKRLELITDDVLVIAGRNLDQSFTEEFPGLEARWQSRLEELQDHLDCALFLSLIYIRQKRHEEAILLVADVVLATESDRWLPLCTTILEGVSGHSSRLRKLRSETRLRFFRAYGRCLSEVGRYEEALAQFEKMRMVAMRRRDWESVGIALLNIGNNYHKQGDIASASRFYQRVSKLARINKCTMLESHALGNLGQIEIHIDPRVGIEFLCESIELKKRCNDKVGIAGSKQMLAQAYAELGDYDSAFRFYDEAETEAKELHLVHLETVLLNNKANTLFAAGNRSDALRLFKKARSLADAEGYDNLKTCATEGMARVYYNMNKLEMAQTWMEELLRLANKPDEFEYVMIAHHGLWASKTRLGDQDGAARHFLLLTRLARKKKALQWLIRGLVDRSRPIEDGDFVGADPQRFKDLVQKEARRNDKAAMAALWIELANISVPQDIAGAIDAIHKSIACCEGRSEAADDLIKAHEFLFTLHWENSRNYDEAMRTLDTLAAVAKQHGNVEKELAAIDQKGVCLQDLGRGNEALPLHRHVCDHARKHKLGWLAINSLHNLAECHRRLGDANAAVRTFKMARKVAAESADELSVIQIDHGHGLALQNAQKYDEAIELFKRCRDRSKIAMCWSEYVRACEAIANLSWTRGRRKTAANQYKEALVVCDAYSVIEQKAPIAFNLSRLLRILGKPGEAHKVLAKHIELVNDPLVLSDYHSTFAELCEERNRLDDARKHWQIAVQAAENVGNVDEIAYCRSNYAEFERRRGDPMRSISELDELLKEKLSEEDRGIALMQLFEALLQLKSEKRAEELFQATHEHLLKHGPTEQLVDLYMAVFDHNWMGNRDSRFKSLQAYVAAISAAASDDACKHHIADVTAHVSIKLTERGTAPSSQQLRWLAKQLEDWLTEQITGVESISMLMYPLRYAEKMIPLNNDPVKFLMMHERMSREFTDD